MNLNEVFEKCADEYLEFGRIETKLSKRPDLHAFMLLDAILPGDNDMIAASEHDEIYLEVDCDALSVAATEDQIRDLIRCGVRFDRGLDSLCMYV